MSVTQLIADHLASGSIHLCDIRKEDLAEWHKAISFMCSIRDSLTPNALNQLVRLMETVYEASDKFSRAAA